MPPRANIWQQTWQTKCKISPTSYFSNLLLGATYQLNLFIYLLLLTCSSLPNVLQQLSSDQTIKSIIICIRLLPFGFSPNIFPPNISCSENKNWESTVVKTTDHDGVPIAAANLHQSTEWIVNIEKATVTRDARPRIIGHSRPSSIHQWDDSRSRASWLGNSMCQPIRSLCSADEHCIDAVLEADKATRNLTQSVSKQ